MLLSLLYVPRRAVISSPCVFTLLLLCFSQHLPFVVDVGVEGSTIRAFAGSQDRRATRALRESCSQQSTSPQLDGKKNPYTSSNNRSPISCLFFLRGNVSRSALRVTITTPCLTHMVHQSLAATEPDAPRELRPSPMAPRLFRSSAEAVAVRMTGDPRAGHH